MPIFSPMNLSIPTLMDILYLLRSSLIMKIKVNWFLQSGPPRFPLSFPGYYWQISLRSDPGIRSPLSNIQLLTRPMINSTLIPRSFVITKGLQDLRALQTKNYLIIDNVLHFKTQREYEIEFRLQYFIKSSQEFTLK